MIKQTVSHAVQMLMTPEAVRERCGQLFKAAEVGELKYFDLNLNALERTVFCVINEIKNNYPNGVVPFHSRWRHFELNNTDLWATVVEKHRHLTREEIARARIDLAVISVLLDAGAGPKWTYYDTTTGLNLGRSEGLALASLRLFESGILSADGRDDPLRADAKSLESLKCQSLATALQIKDENSLIGLPQRTKLLVKLGEALRQHPEVFGYGIDARPGNLFDHLKSKARNSNIPAREILLVLLHNLGEIWPNGKWVGDTCIGDIGYHSLIRINNETDKMIPFHKLSQWMTYSLIEPLEGANLNITDLDALTGLAEYRNGGLFIDTGVLNLKDPDLITKSHAPDSEIVVEWRALTIVLLDKIANLIRVESGKNKNTLPMASILQGGTWAAGRRLANEIRDNGEPPFIIDSDGTVF
ncbi:MAG: uracil phosphoribosyltransferase [Magnetovibrio sp.]|nr:uracil phosphoribosyltransferase [Magnetovibrio sp.]